MALKLCKESSLKIKICIKVCYKLLHKISNCQLPQNCVTGSLMQLAMLTELAMRCLCAPCYAIYPFSPTPSSPSRPALTLSTVTAAQLFLQNCHYGLEDKRLSQRQSAFCTIFVLLLFALTSLSLSLSLFQLLLATLATAAAALTLAELSAALTFHMAALRNNLNF